MRGRARPRSRIARRVGQGAALALLAPVGIAHLAVNTVPVTHAGQVEQSISLPTTLNGGDGTSD